MSPRLLFLLHAHHPLERGRDRIDARLAAEAATPVPAEDVLLEAA